MFSKDHAVELLESMDWKAMEEQNLNFLCRYLLDPACEDKACACNEEVGRLLGKIKYHPDDAYEHTFKKKDQVRGAD